MTCFWSIATVDRLPDAFQDGMFLPEGFPENYEPSFESREVQFSLLCRTITRDESAVRALLEPALHKLGATTLENLVTLTSDVQCMIKPEREAVRSMSPGEVSVLDWFVAFQRGNQVAQEQAVEMIKQGTLRWRWQFWR